MSGMDRMNASSKEHEWVLRLIEGDEEAFCQLYSRYKSRLLFFAVKFLKSSDYAEDVLQDVFTNIWVGRRMINPDIPFSSYLFTIVKNRVLNQIRDLEKQQALRNIILKESADYDEVTKNEILSDDLRGVLQKAFASMTPRQKEVFQLSREGQLSYKEIAVKLNISVNTVHEHVAAALHIIRSYVVKYSSADVEVILLLLCLNA